MLAVVLLTAFVVVAGVVIFSLVSVSKEAAAEALKEGATAAA